MLRNGSFGVLLLPRMRMRYPALGTQYTASPHLLELYSTTRKASIAFVQLSATFVQSCAEQLVSFCDQFGAAGRDFGRTGPLHLVWLCPGIHVISRGRLTRLQCIPFH